MTIILNIAVLAMSPFLFLGIINKTKACWAGRKGASIVQPLYDCLRLMKKGQVISPTTTWVFQAAPTLGLATVLTAGLFVPLVGSRSVISFEGDFVLFAYLLALGRFFGIIAALDTGSSFEGMGASREATFASLVEPAFFITMASVAAVSGTASFSRIFQVLHQPSGLLQVVMVLSLLSFFIMLVTEGCRVPVDDPQTHLELTMIHEVMVLDNSGPDLALITYAAGLKMVIIGAIMANIILPAPLSPGLSAALLIAVLGVLAVLIGLLESVTARLRMTHVPQFIFIMSTNAIITMTVLLLYKFGGLR